EEVRRGVRLEADGHLRGCVRLEAREAVREPFPELLEVLDLLEQLDYSVIATLQFIGEALRLAVEVPLDLAEERPFPERDVLVERPVGPEINARKPLLEVVQLPAA